MRLGNDRIDKIISEEITKAEVEGIVSRKLGSSYESRDFEKAVRKIAAEVLSDLYRTLWNRSSSWKGGITK